MNSSTQQSSDKQITDKSTDQTTDKQSIDKWFLWTRQIIKQQNHVRAKQGLCNWDDFDITSWTDDGNSFFAQARHPKDDPGTVGPWTGGVRRPRKFVPSEPIQFNYDATSCYWSSQQYDFVVKIIDNICIYLEKLLKPGCTLRTNQFILTVEPKGKPIQEVRNTWGAPFQSFTCTVESTENQSQRMTRSMTSDQCNGLVVFGRKANCASYSLEVTLCRKNHPNVDLCWSDLFFN